MGDRVQRGETSRGLGVRFSAASQQIEGWIGSKRTAAHYLLPPSAPILAFVSPSSSPLPPPRLAPPSPAAPLPTTPPSLPAVAGFRIATAYKIMVVRRGTQTSRDAADFLIYISGDAGLERLVLIGMLADAGDFVLQLLRFFDTENYDSTAAPRHVNDLVNNLDWAFVRKKIVMQEDSCTSVMLRTVASIMSSVTVNNESRRIGAVGGRIPKHIIDACFARLNSLTVMVIEVLKAEFQWSFANNFSVFDLEKTSEHDTTKCLARLAHVDGVDLTLLKTQYIRAYAVAVKLRSSNPDLRTEDAWRNAWVRIGKPRILQKVLARVLAMCGCTTSGIEQLHALQDLLWPARRHSTCLTRENDEMTMLADHKTRDKNVILKTARRLWPIIRTAVADPF